MSQTQNILNSFEHCIKQLALKTQVCESQWNMFKSAADSAC